MSDVDAVLKRLKDEDIPFVDLRFTDPRGKWQHLAMASHMIEEETFSDGVMFDGSSIAGWKDISESDMALVPDPASAVIDPFAAQNSLIMFCDVMEPSTGEAYGRDPRSTAGRAEQYLKYTGTGDEAFFGPEAEFFVFDDVRYDVSMNNVFYSIDQEEGPYNAGRQYEGGNVGHRPPIKGGYFPVPPVDSLSDLRAEMLTLMSEMGITTEKHHHEVAPSQNELGMKFNTLVRGADEMQIYKYVVHNVAHSYGKTATFMPKPVIDDNGSGMHVHQSIFKGGKPVFAGNAYADLSDSALYYIGGIIRHAKALNAFTNPLTNSYKRLIPGFEAPVLLAYSARNRSAACRIPYTTSPNGKRVEVRFPDPGANPYYAFAAMLMAGLDGIENKIHPGDPIDKNLYDLPPEELEGVPTVCGSLREALDALDADRDFLKKGDVFSDDQIDGYLGLKWDEVYAFEHTPHPIEFSMYYSV
ncbi:MAG: type I glutamate--ammonia ligase [Alphaproteobacteria bacterium]|jgi:glutamine synthetase|nr:type I glutamate--ammonia ligase [Alphaproteobacteria bacterium]|tara:strand:- start:98 stop:1507 length:1410 start_codon:yes stop_codon:yes gene_type:complete